MNKSVAAAAAIVVILALWMLSGIFKSNSEADSTAGIHQESSTDARASDSIDGKERPPMRVQTTLATIAPMERQITLQGQLDPVRRLVVRAQTGGIVENIPARKGARVIGDELLVQLSIEGRNAQRNEYSAQLKSARSEQKAAKRLNKQGLQSQLALEQATARLASASSALTRLNIEIENIRITAPFAGILNDIHVEQGQLIERGTAIAELVDDSSFLVRANATQQTVSQINTGQEVIAKLITGEELQGKITFLSAIADPTTRSFMIEAAIDNPGGALAAGVSTSLSIPVETIQAVLISPSSLALGQDGEMGVKTANDDNTVGFFPVELISTDNAGAWVTGVPDNARVITLGQGFVNIGDEIEPVSAPQNE